MITEPAAPRVEIEAFAQQADPSAPGAEPDKREDEPAPSEPGTPSEPSEPGHPSPEHRPDPDLPFQPHDPVPPPGRPDTEPEKPFLPGDPSPPPMQPPTAPPSGPMTPQATGADSRVRAEHFGGRIVAEPPARGAPSTLHALMLRLDGLIAGALDQPAQRELAALVALLPRLERPQNAPLVAIAERAVTALSQSPPRVELAAQLRQSIERSSRGLDSFRRAVRFTTPAVRVLLGIMLFLFVGIPLIVLAATPLVEAAMAQNLSPRQVVMVGVAGAVGSMISVMVRIHDFDQTAAEDPAAQIFIGALRPVIGVGIALFGYTVVKAGILPIGVPAEQAPYFFVALAFICGFSERLANDLITKSEQTLSDAIRGGPTPSADAGTNAPAPAAHQDPPV